MSRFIGLLSNGQNGDDPDPSRLKMKSYREHLDVLFAAPGAEEGSVRLWRGRAMGAFAVSGLSVTPCEEPSAAAEGARRPCAPAPFEPRTVESFVPVSP